jgi:Actin like proteins N terminal domain
MSDLYLAVDTGGSQTKVIFQLDSHDRPHTFTMPPQIEQVPKNRLQHFFERQGWIGNPAPQQRAWVEWDNQVFILGDFAQKFNPEDRLKERKYENTLYKVLAAVGVIVADQRDLIKRRKLTVSLAVLLPWNEYSDRELFKEQLTWMLQAFSFQDCPIKVKLDLDVSSRRRWISSNFSAAAWRSLASRKTVRCSNVWTSQHHGSTLR